jgi:hypothetical protein
MGIIIGDTITLDNGLTAQSTYGSFGDSILTLEKSRISTLDENNTEVITYEYRLSCKGSIWSSKEYRDALKPKLHAENISIVVQPSQLNSNLYTILYTNWKSKYTTVTDSSS